MRPVAVALALALAPGCAGSSCFKDPPRSKSLDTTAVEREVEIRSGVMMGTLDLNEHFYRGPYGPPKAGTDVPTRPLAAVPDGRHVATFAPAGLYLDMSIRHGGTVSRARVGAIGCD